MADDLDQYPQPQSRLAWAVAHAGLGICTVAKDGAVLSASGELRRMLGYSTGEEMAALNFIRDVCVDPDEHSRVLEAADASEPTWVETRWKRRDGSLLVVRATARRAADGDMPDAYEMLAEDVTERRRQEEAVRRSERMSSLGAVLAGVMVPLGSVAAILSARDNPEIYQVLGGARFFLATMLGEMLCFGVFVGIAVIYRRRPEIHRPMMLLATVVIQSGAFGRFPYIENLAVFPPLYVWGPVLLFGGLLFVLQWGMSRTLNRWYLMGYAGMVMASFLSVAVGRTALWNGMVSAFAP